MINVKAFVQIIYTIYKIAVKKDIAVLFSSKSEKFFRGI